MDNLTNNKITVTYGTEFTKEVDATLDFFKRGGLILSIDKQTSVDSIKYTIDFINSEAVFLYGRTRPQIKLI